MILPANFAAQLEYRFPQPYEHFPEPVNLQLEKQTIAQVIFFTLYNITSSVLQNDPHRCWRTSLIVSTYRNRKYLRKTDKRLHIR